MSSRPTPQLELDTRTPLVKSVTKSGQLLLADVIGNTAELAFLRYRDSVDNTLPFLRKAFHAVMCEPVRWFQKPIESALEHAKNFEDKESHDKRIAQTEQQRLNGLVDTAYDYTTAFGVGSAALVGSEKALSKFMHTEGVSWKLWAADAAIHVGIVACMGTPMMKNNTQKINSTIENVMKAAGWKPEEAKSDARFATVYIVPNYINWVSNSAMSTAGYYGVWDKLKSLFKQVDAKASGQGICIS